MPRVKSGVTAHARHKKILKLAKGYRGARSKQFKKANELVMNAATRANGMSYSRFICGLTKAGVQVNRKMLADVAINDAAAFAKLVEVAKSNL